MRIPVVFVLFLLACQAPVQQTIPSAIEVPVHGLLPKTPGVFAPSFLQVEGEKISGTTLADSKTCARCHADAADQWQSSAHFFASFNNPLYRFSVERLRREVGKKQSFFCAGCHDIALFVDGEMEKEIAADDPRAYAGVSCRVCHGITEASLDGNGSYTLRAEPIFIPSIEDPESVAKHKQSAAPKALSTSALCISCHKAFLDESTGNTHHLPGMDDASSWLRSSYAGSDASLVDDEVSEKRCQDCHMAQEQAPRDLAARNGTIASHRFLGGHTLLAAIRNDSESLARIQSFLQGIISIDIAVASYAGGEHAYPAETISIQPGKTLTLDVVLRNLSVGHRFPGGTLDAQDTVIEVEVRDALGKKLASTEGSAPHRLSAYMADKTGKALLTRETHQFQTVVFNNTLAPREATVVQYGIALPPTLSKEQLPLQVTANVVHKSRNKELQEISCEESKLERGKSFVQFFENNFLHKLDPCVEIPKTVIASVKIPLGKSYYVVSAKDSKRLWVHALGMKKSLQERLGEAKQSATEALRLAVSDRERGQILALLADIATRQGRTGDAIALLDKATSLLGAHPALDALRGEAYASVWRFAEAVPPLQKAVAKTPSDDGLIAKLAMALGSLGRDREALTYSIQGLQVQPRNADLLRVQALSLTALLGESNTLAKAATQAFLACRPPDVAPRVRAACSSKIEGCANERNPVHLHMLVP